MTSAAPTPEPLDPEAHRSDRLNDRLRFGAAYYPEYQPRLDLDRDLDLMKAAGFTVIRVGESVWSTWEPRDGEFDLDWLQPTLDGAKARGIDVVLGTPTYAVPMWLVSKHPEIAGEGATGVRHPWGARQEVDVTHPDFLTHAERVIRQVVSRYADHQAVIGYQVDNEPGAMLLHNEGTFRQFLAWLERRYGTPERLSDEWGLVYWSHRITDFADLWRPDGNAQPQYDLAWRRFQDEVITDYIGWQADIVREYARPGQVVTTCISFDRPAMDEVELAAGLDLTATNPYYAMQDHLDASLELERPQPWIRTGVHGLFELADRSFGVRQERFWVTETNAQSIGGSSHHLPPYPGQLLQAGTALVSRGAAMIEYWHWHTLHFGTETSWMGVLPHSQVPGRIYSEVSELGSLLGTLGATLRGYEPDADVALLWSNDAKHGLDFQPPWIGREGARGYAPRNPDAYTDAVNAFHRGVLEAGGQARIVHVEQVMGWSASELVKRFPMLVAAGLYVADDALLGLLADYARAGGHLVLGPRTGYADDEARARLTVAPGVLADVAGVHYEEFSTLAQPVPVAGVDGFETPGDARALAWADGLIVDHAEVLATYRHPFLERFPAVTRAIAGEGRVTHVGTLPDPALARALFAQTITPRFAEWTRPSSVTLMSGAVEGGRRVVFAHNWAPVAATCLVPVASHDLRADADVPGGTTLDLGPWGLTVLAVEG
ncbi:beta-galactosidase [Aestuariimicrobium soli]|uniref:beta-galactosidase n=1 Tax=Aestuariimicrobium soli TaxID=2035834 RepID=UPI003EB6A530